MIAPGAAVVAASGAEHEPFTIVLPAGHGEVSLIGGFAEDELLGIGIGAPSVVVAGCC